jgi:hypothetical protein
MTIERATVNILGEECYVDMLEPMLEALAAAKVGGDITPSAGGGTPPDKKIV